MPIATSMGQRTIAAGLGRLALVSFNKSAVKGAPLKRAFMRAPLKRASVK